MKGERKVHRARRVGRAHVACRSASTTLPGGELRGVAQVREAAVAVQELDRGRKRRPRVPSLPPGKLDRVEVRGFHAVVDLGGCGSFEAGVGSEVGVVGEGHADVAFGVTASRVRGRESPFSPSSCLRFLQKRSSRELARWFSAEQ